MSLDRKLEEASFVMAVRLPVTKYMATSSEEEESIRKARERDPKITRDKIYGNDVVAEGIIMGYLPKIYVSEMGLLVKYLEVFSGSGNLLSYIPFIIAAHKDTNIALDKLSIATKEAAVIVKYNKINGEKCAITYNGDNLNGKDVSRELLEVCIKQDDEKRLHLHAREVINSGGRRTVGFYSTEGYKEGEMRYLDLNLASKPENINAINQSLEQIIKMMEKGKNPLLDEEAKKAFLKLMNNLDNISK